MATRNGSATWNGNLADGNGSLKVGDGAFEGSYSFSSRFEEGEGTNPEELIAAAHAACFSMALSHSLAEAGHDPRSVTTTAKAHLRNVDGAPTIAKIELDTEGDVRGIDAAEFQKFAEQAKSDCLVSRALAGVGEMELSARLAG
jgi:osmotically inducible protein OsmC